MLKAFCHKRENSFSQFSVDKEFCQKEFYVEYLKQRRNTYLYIFNKHSIIHIICDIYGCYVFE